MDRKAPSTSKVSTSKVSLNIADLDVDAVLDILKSEDLLEFRELVEEKQLHGRNILNITEGIIKLWRPKLNATKLVNFVENLKKNPHQYIENNNSERKNCKRSTTFNGNDTGRPILIESSNIKFESSQRVVEKERDFQNQEFVFKMENSESIEKILYTEPPKSFLYRNKMKRIVETKEKINSSYVPMDMGTPKQPKPKFKIKLNDYTNFDLHKLKMFPIANRKDENKFNDRGYYALNRVSMVNETSHSYDLVGDIESKGKFSDDTIQPDRGKVSIEDHFYEDLNYCSIAATNKSNLKRSSTVKALNPLSKSPCMLRINEIFSTLKFPIQNKTPNSLGKVSEDLTINKIKDIARPKQEITEEVATSKLNIHKNNESMQNFTSDIKKQDYKNTSKKSKLHLYDSDYHIYENRESSSGLYDSIETGLNETKTERTGRFVVTKVAVEEYLEPIQTNKEYADVIYKEKEESLVSVILRIFENSFGFGKECEKTQDPLPPSDQSKATISNIEFVEPPERPMDTLHKWNENLRANFRPEVKNTVETRGVLNPRDGVGTQTKSRAQLVTNMADRPLPVPVENEFYYMEVDRLEASKLLEGHADGTFILRPSSQPFHVYTISLVFRGQVHNVGIRRRPDGKLALGFSKRSEQSFQTIKELIEHHYKEKLLLIVDGQKIGSTQLRRLHD